MFGDSEFQYRQSSEDELINDDPPSAADVVDHATAVAASERVANAQENKFPAARLQRHLPGQEVSVDHFVVCSTKGRLFTSYN